VRSRSQLNQIPFAAVHILKHRNFAIGLLTQALDEPVRSEADPTLRTGAEDDVALEVEQARAQLLALAAFG
jgi:hypothetical protein